MNLIINADDFGMSKGTTDGIIYALKKGFVTSTSLLANVEFTDYAIEKAKENGITEVGLHCNLIIGKSLTNNEKFCFTKNDRTSKEINQEKILSKITYEEAKEELLKQYNYIVNHGLRVNHLDNHLLLETYPQIMQAMIDIAKEKNLPMRFWNEKLKNQINNYGVKTPDVICRKFFKQGISEQTLENLISENKNTTKTIEIMCHVAFMDEYTYEFTDYIDRETELKTLENFYLKNGFSDINLISHNELKGV